MKSNFRTMPWRRPGWAALPAGIAILVILAILALFAGARQSLRTALTLRSAWPTEADTLGLPPVAMLRFLSVGHQEMAADLVAARANVYFGSQIASRGDQIWLDRALNAAADLDPRFHRLYLRGAAMLVYNGRAITVEALLAANRLLERGSHEFPGDWELPFQRGFNLLFELPRLVGEDDPRVADWRQQGVEALRQATLLDGVPPWLPNLAARMLTKQGGEELAIAHLERTFEATNNPETRAEIARNLAELHGRHLADELAVGAASLQKLIAERYPYAPEAFSLILGPRVAPGVDLDATLQPHSGSR
jgi:hypothetical protein